VYYTAELELNARFRTFAVNCSLLYGGHNTVGAQLRYYTKWAVSKGGLACDRSDSNKASLMVEYTEIGGDETLPLGEEFQDHIRCFVKPQAKKVPQQYAMVSKVIDQLG
jgi:inositol 1,4,5-triphosphate receptor type 1